ncbi:MAG: hypothetical protein EXR74_10055 [Bdellovibrionales bacterium]|nr:hypothetical protein [Bdellovibrionales bacterium]
MSAWKAGKMLWFDSVAGEGLVIDDFGKTHYVHEAAIEKSKKTKNNSSQPTIADNSKVKFTLYSNGYLSQVDRIKPV